MEVITNFDDMYKVFPNPLESRRLYRKMNEFRTKGKYTDVNVYCEDRVYECHQIVLAISSEYFDALFNGDFPERNFQEVTLTDVVEVGTFEQLLQFMYKSYVSRFDDENIYNLLVGSERLRMPTVQEQCVAYLSERSVPRKDAVKIFQFGYAIQKKTVLRAVSCFILENLNHFSTDRSILEMTFDELSALLAYFSPSTKSVEYLMLRTVFFWARLSTHASEARRSSCMELLRQIQYQHIQTERINEVVIENMMRQYEVCSIDSLVVSSDPNFASPTLHLYVHTHDVTGAHRMNIATMKRYGRDGVDWYPSRVIPEPVLETMRNVVLDNRLYCLKLTEDDLLRFGVCDSADLTEGVKTLKPPPDSIRWPREIGDRYHMCSDRSNTIYTYSPWGSRKIHFYEGGLDKWFPISVRGNEFPNSVPIVMTCHENRLFLVDHCSRTFAYDRRAGTFEELSICALNHGDENECCTHKGRIYLSTNPESEVLAEAYDPVAQKWTVLKENDDLLGEWDDHRLVSFENRLWIIASCESVGLHVGVYDSFVETWQSVNLASEDVMRGIRDTSQFVGFHLADVSVFKPF